MLLRVSLSQILHYTPLLPMQTKDDSRHRAQVMVNRAVKDLTGGAVDLSDLADTFNLCAGLDELQDLIEQADELSTSREHLIDVAHDIAAELLDEEGLDL